MSHDHGAFDDWLRSALRALQADEDVFHPYIVGILEGDEDDDDDKAEAVDGLLAGLGDDATAHQKFRHDIFDRWKKRTATGEEAVDGAAEAGKKLADLDLNSRLASITATQAEAYEKSKTTKTSFAAPDESVKAAILQQYAKGVEESSEEDDDGSDDGGDFAPANQNKEMMAAKEKEKRDKMKEMAAQKKEKDKMDREKQKRMAEERKEKAKEKTQKRERHK